MITFPFVILRDIGPEESFIRFSPLMGEYKDMCAFEAGETLPFDVMRKMSDFAMEIDGIISPDMLQ